jgi:hypothetical protein
LRRLAQKLRAAFPRARLRVRLDGGLAGDDVLRFLEAEGIEYVVALGKNRRLEKWGRRLMGRARMLSKASGETEHLFGKTCYAARPWKPPPASSRRPRWFGMPPATPRTTRASW